MYTKAHHNKPIDNLSVLITGGAGFVGSHIAEYFLKFGARRVVVLDNFSTGFRENIELLKAYPQFELIEGSIADIEVCHKACAGIDVICHQAALGSVPRSIREPNNTTMSNITGFVNMVTAARDAGIRRFVYASSSSVYGDEPNLPKVEQRIGKQLSPYAISKYTNELFAENFGKLYSMEFIGLRYFNVFGPRQSPKGAYAAVVPLFAEACLSGKPCYIDGDGLQTRDFTFIDNVVQMNVKSLLSDNPEALNQVYNVACGENISVVALFDLIKEISGSAIEATHRDARAGDVRNSLADVSKAMNLIGYNPAIKLREGMGYTIASFNA